MALVALVLAELTCPVETWSVKAKRQITFAKPYRVLVGDGGEAVTVLEVGLSDDVALEARSRGNHDGWRSVRTRITTAGK
jgi:hypothetical protein